METIETIHLSTKDLSCPICYQKYGVTSYQPMSLSCGHNVCSSCLKKVWSCPLCRARIHNRTSIAKNMLISSILEQKEKIKECKIHSRPLEFFCKDHKQLICVDCAIEEGHFSHNFVRLKEVDSRAQKLRSLMKKVDMKDEQSNNRFKSFLDKEKKSVKRRIDDFLDEYLEPLLTIKKKLHKEIDSFVIIQGNTYEKETTRESILQWKKDNESILLQWEGEGGVEAASHIIHNETEEIEKRINNYESHLEKVQQEAQVNLEHIVENIREKMSHAKGPWKKLNRKIGQIMTTFKSETDPNVEKEYLIEFLRGHGVEGSWIQKETEDVLAIKGENKENKVKDFDTKFFECSLEKLSLTCQKIQGLYFGVLCKVIEHVVKLIDLKLAFQGIRDEELVVLADSIVNMNALEKLNVSVISENITNNSFSKFLSSLTALTKLQILEIAFEDCDDLGNQKIVEIETVFSKLKGLSDFTIRLRDCDNTSDDCMMVIFQGISCLLNLSKLNITISDCKNLSYKIVDSLGKAIVSLRNIEELTLALEGFYEPSNPINLMSLASGIASLSKLTKLSISFAENIYLPSYVIRKFFAKIILVLPNLNELSIDLSRCKEVVNITLENIGHNLTQLTQIHKLAFRCRMCGVSEKGVLGLGAHLSKINSLRSLTLDYRHCRNIEYNAHAKITELYNKMTKLIEKEILFASDLKQDANETLSGNRTNRTLASRDTAIRLFSPIDNIRMRDNFLDIEHFEDLENTPDSFDFFQNYLDTYNDLDHDMQDDEMEENRNNEDYAVMSIHSSELSF